MVDPRSIRINKHSCSQLHLEAKVASLEHGFKFKIKWNRWLYSLISVVLSSIRAAVCASNPHSLQWWSHQQMRQSDPDYSSKYFNYSI